MAEAKRDVTDTGGVDSEACRARSRGLSLILVSLFATLLLSTLVYGFLIPQTPARHQKPAFELVPQMWHWKLAVEIGLPVPHDATRVALLVGSFVLLAFAAYIATAILVWNKKTRLPDVRWGVAASVLLFAVSVGFLPNVDTDIFNYIMRGRVAAVYGESPYRVAVDEHADDPIYRYAEKRYTATTKEAKMPSWQLCSAGLAWLGGDNPVSALLVYRTAFFLLNVVNVFLVWQIVRRLQPERALFAVVLYGWNPIVVCFGQSKTDTIMAFYLLCGIFLLSRGRDRWAAVFLSLSVWVKLVTLPMLGAAWLGDLKLRNWSRLRDAAVIFVLVTLAVYLPYGDILNLMVRHLTQMDRAAAATSGVLRQALSAAFLLLAVAVAYRQDKSLERLIRGWAVLALFFALFLTKLNLSWYLIVPVAVVSLTTDWRLAAVVIAGTFCSFLINLRDAAFNHDFPAPQLTGISRFAIYLAVPATTILLIVASSLWLRARTLVQTVQKP